MVPRELGARWSAAQAAALGISGDDLQQSCRSALELFKLAVHEVREVFVVASSVRRTDCSLAQWASGRSWSRACQLSSWESCSDS